MIKILKFILNIIVFIIILLLVYLMIYLNKYIKSYNSFYNFDNEIYLLIYLLSCLILLYFFIKIILKTIKKYNNIKYNIYPIGYSHLKHYYLIFLLFNISSVILFLLVMFFNITNKVLLISSLLSIFVYLNYYYKIIYLTSHYNNYKNLYRKYSNYLLILWTILLFNISLNKLINLKIISNLLYFNNYQYYLIYILILIDVVFIIFSILNIKRKSKLI